MTSIWSPSTAGPHLNAAMDSCTCEIVGWSPELRCHTNEAIALLDAALASRGIEPSSRRSAPTCVMPDRSVGISSARTGLPLPT
jgi:hypothetical protein